MNDNDFSIPNPAPLYEQLSAAKAEKEAAEKAAHEEQRKKFISAWNAFSPSLKELLNNNIAYFNFDSPIGNWHTIDYVIELTKKLQANGYFVTHGKIPSRIGCLIIQLK